MYQRYVLMAFVATMLGNLATVSFADDDFGSPEITSNQMRQFLPLAKAHPFDDGDRHVVLQLQGEAKPVSLPANITWMSKSWDRIDARCPYLVYLPEQDRVLMLVMSTSGRTSFTASDDHGKSWGPRCWLDHDGNGKPNHFSMLGLTYLGQGRLMAFAEDLHSFFVSLDSGNTWNAAAVSTPPQKTYAWDPILVIPDEAGKLRLVQACYGETGIAWGSTEGPYSQGYLRSSSDLGKTWSEPERIRQWLGANEICLAVAGNGDWIAACRTDIPARFAPLKMDNYSGMGISISKDAGKTWSPIKSLYEWGHHHPSIIVLPDDRILMSYVARLGYPNNADGFPQFGIEAIVSSDHGQTWDLDHRYVLAAWVGQIKTPHLRYWGSAQSTSSVLLPDGVILTAFGTGFNITEAGVAKDIKDVAVVRWRTAK